MRDGSGLGAADLHGPRLMGGGLDASRASVERSQVRVELLDAGSRAGSKDLGPFGTA